MTDRQNLDDFHAVLSNFDHSVGKIALRARSLVLETFPGAFEVVWVRQRNTGYGTGPKKMTEHFCWIAPAKAHVTFGFNYGAELPDPARLLEGTGRLFRHVKLLTEADVDRPALRKLVKAATKHRVPQTGHA